MTQVLVTDLPAPPPDVIPLPMPPHVPPLPGITPPVPPEMPESPGTAALPNGAPPRPLPLPLLR